MCEPHIGETVIANEPLHWDKGGPAGIFKPGTKGTIQSYEEPYLGRSARAKVKFNTPTHGTIDLYVTVGSREEVRLAR